MEGSGTLGTGAGATGDGTFGSGAGVTGVDVAGCAGTTMSVA